MKSWILHFAMAFPCPVQGWTAPLSRQNYPAGFIRLPTPNLHPTANTLVARPASIAIPSFPLYAATSASSSDGKNDEEESTSDAPKTTSEQHDYSTSASGLFGNIRVPAALFAGAAAAAAFALPIEHGEGVRVGLIKRFYALLMMGALSSQTVAVVVSTLAMGAITTQTTTRLAPSLHLYMRQYFDFEWISARLHFLAGVLMFSTAVGLRAWITISCPVFSKAALGTILSATFLCFSFWQQLEAGSFMDGAWRLPIRYFAALWKKSQTSGLFAVSLITTIATVFYVLLNFSHVYQYLLN